MEPHFWHERWTKNEIAFHASEANALMVAHFAALALAPGDRVFVPLCGKTRDIGWLLAQGHRVVGAELSRIAVEQLFAELGIAPEVTGVGSLERFSAPDVEIFVGDIFDLGKATLGAVDAIYDRAALVALPVGMRERYAGHLADISSGAPQLLVCFEYDQSLMNGPPFSVDGPEVARVHGARYRIAPLETVPLQGLIRGKVRAREAIYLLT